MRALTSLIYLCDRLTGTMYSMNLHTGCRWEDENNNLRARRGENWRGKHGGLLRLYRHVKSLWLLNADCLLPPSYMMSHAYTSDSCQQTPIMASYMHIADMRRLAKLPATLLERDLAEHARICRSIPTDQVRREHLCRRGSSLNW